MDTIEYKTEDRVYVSQRGDGPSGKATITGFGVDGIGRPIAKVRLDEYNTATRGGMTGRDAAGQDWHEWLVDVDQQRKIEG
jgi:hypothetical protein